MQERISTERLDAPFHIWSRYKMRNFSAYCP